MHKPTGIVIDPRYQDHDTGRGHPERSERIQVLLPLSHSADARFKNLEVRPATGDELALVHDGAYVREVEATRHHERFAFDADTPTSAQSFDTACLATGGFLSLLDAVMAGDVANGFAFVRPPGHHAERHRAMGFCLFNHVAVGAAYLRSVHGLRRVLVVDWDLHHGNGTQNMFANDPGVLYVSTHQYPYYPGTGAADESGGRDGEGYTVNVPLPAGCGDAEYVDAFRRIVEPIAHEYAPEMVLISAGFDAHGRDPLGGMEVSEAGYRTMTRILLDVARVHSQGRCAAILEGGYDLTAIRDSSSVVLDELAGVAAPAHEKPAPDHAQSRVGPLLERIRHVQQRYWRI